MRRAPRGSILVVDDDPGIRSLVATVFEQAGYETSDASTAEEALERARGPAGPRLFIVDVRLPGLSGYELARELRAEFGDDVAIVFLSGERVEPLDRAAGLHFGGDDYVIKPFAPEELLARVDRLVGRSDDDGGGAEPHATLSDRELETLRLLAAGLKQREIARRLVLSPKTVATHTRNLLGKLDVRTQAQAVAEGFRRGLLGK